MSLLQPFGAAFGALSRLRVALYGRGLLRRERLLGPVISVGNISVGGTGKTPLVERVATLLRDGGRPVAVLSRGYRGSYPEAARLVSDGREVLGEAAELGDEPVMLARRLKGVVVAVGRRRADAGRLVEQQFGRCVHVLDDGFQHLALERQLDLVCAHPSDVDDDLLPAGRLREPLSALRRAQLVLVDVTDGEDARQRLRTMLGRGQVIGFRRRPVAPAGLDRPLLLSAIARPERFEADARRVVPGVVGAVRFADHHRLTPDELASVARRADEAKAGCILTTAKDAVRLPSEIAGRPVAVMELAIDIDDDPLFAHTVLAAAT